MQNNLKRQKAAVSRFDDIDITDYMVANSQGIQDDVVLDKPLNFNISAYRVLYILSLLVQYQTLGMDDLNQFLQENPYIQRSYNNETITKYINTLRKVGCNIPKTSSRQNYRYVLQENPFPLSLNELEMLALKSVIEILENSPDEVLQRRFLTFLQQVTWMLEPAQKEQIHGMIAAKQAVLSIEVKRQLMTQYKRYCQDKMVLELYYQSDAYTRSGLLVEPIRVFQEKKRLYLLAKDKQTQKQVKLDIEKILEIGQRPNKVQIQEYSVQVVFQLYDRLARTYRPYPGEAIVFAKDDVIQVCAKTDDIDQLLNRLLKYNTLCQVISPMSARNEMLQRIERLLKISEWGVVTALDAKVI